VATIEDLLKRINEVETVLQLALSQFNKLLINIDNHIDIKISVKGKEISGRLEEDFEEQIRKLKEDFEKQIHESLRKIFKTEADIQQTYLPSIEKRFEIIAKDWDKRIQEIVYRNMKKERQDYLQEIEKVSNEIKESGTKISLLKATEEFERKMIIDALKSSNYIQTHAAGILGISRRILKYKMDKLGIADQEDNND
jgi:DNA-binding NtrC family response regulator